jgi:hypothetical protein
MRSLATTRVGTDSVAACLLHWQLAAGQPQPGQILPTAVE